MEIIFFTVILLSVAIGSWLILREVKRRESKPEDNQSLLMLQNQINELNRTLDSKLGESTEASQQQLGYNAEIIFVN